MADGSNFTNRAPCEIDDSRRISQALCDIDAATAILECYIRTIPDEQAEDRYVLWAVKEKLDFARGRVEDVPVQDLKDLAIAHAGLT